MSCRALGFRLEHAVFNEINLKHKIESIAFKKTDKNKVAQEFLSTLEDIPVKEVSLRF